MSLFQLSLNVHNVDEAVAYYSKLFGTVPAKHRAGYANFVVADPPLKLIVIEGEGQPGTINHVGIEVDGIDAVVEQTQRLATLAIRPTKSMTPTPVATPHRTRCGPKIPTVSRGRPTPSWPTLRRSGA